MAREPATNATTGALRRLAKVMIVSLVAASLAGCAGDDDDGGADGDASAQTTVAPAPERTALELVKQSIDATRESGTARVSHHLVSDITGFSANEYSEGVADLRSGDGEWTHDMSNDPVGLVPEDTPPEEIVLEAREIGDDLYVSLPPAFEAAGIEETWVKVAAVPAPGTSAFTFIEGVSARVPFSSRFERPEVAFNILSTVTGAREAGPATVRGKETTRYTVDVKLRQMLEDVGLMFYFGNPTTPEELAEIDEVCARAAHVDVFVDSIGRIRSLVVEADLTIVAPHFDPPQSGEAFRELRLAWEFFDYGVEVSVEAPTESVREVT
jgi:hypothetical protein